MPTAEAGLDSPFLAEWRARGPGAARSLARAREMACRLGLDGALRGKPVIGVVGSKGKGTAAVYAAATLAAAGFAVGTVTGPGTTGGRDRIRVDGAVIGRETYAGLGRRVARAAAELG
ncbi:MAG: hypothetical protein LBT54_02755, partial [Bifidobacteriaceae bacterium]|nr:hypothetical protein [Bifidobacteriaceae bacterium]